MPPLLHSPVCYEIVAVQYSIFNYNPTRFFVDLGLVVGVLRTAAPCDTHEISQAVVRSS